MTLYPHSHHKLGVGYALASSFFFGLMAFLVHASSESLSVMQMAFGRCLLALVILFPFMYKHRALILRRRGLLLGVRSLAGSFSFLAYFWNLKLSSVGVATALFDTAPAFTAILGYAFLNEKLQAKQILALILVMLGSFTLGMSWLSGVSPQVFIIGIGGACCASLAYISLRSSAKEFPVSLIVGSLSLTAAVLIVALDPNVLIIPPAYLWMNLSAIAVMALLGQLFLAKSFVYLPAAVATTLSMAALLWGLLLDWLFKRQSPSPQESLSYFLILLGVILLQRRADVT